MNNTVETTKKQTIAITLLWVAAVAALGAALSAIPTVSDASNATKVVETWRMIGFATFAVIFAVLARRPHQNQALWLIAIGNKLALTIAGVLFVTQGDIKGALDLIIFDGGITILLLVAYYFVRSGRDTSVTQ